MSIDDLVITLPAANEVLPDGRLMLLEVTVKQRGNWRVHANDPDDLFPSDFHAHNLEDGTRLNLYTGDIFDKAGRAVVGRMRDRDILFFVRKLMMSKNVNIVEKMKDTRLAKWISEIQSRS